MKTKMGHPSTTAQAALDKSERKSRSNKVWSEVCRYVAVRSRVRIQDKRNQAAEKLSSLDRGGPDAKDQVRVEQPGRGLVELRYGSMAVCQRLQIIVVHMQSDETGQGLLHA